MSNIKWKWIAQDKDGKIYKYEDEPLIKTTSMFIADIGHQKLVQKEIEGLTKHDWKESLINLETHDYKIVDGILIRVDKMEETKWKWIAQDKDGAICKYSILPDLRRRGWYAEENEFTTINMGFADEVSGWKESLINLETHDYKIMDGILIRVDKMEETKWKWIAQDKDGAIGKYSVFPDLRKKGWYAEENEFTLIEMGFSYHVNGWEGSLINLETHDYKIVNRVLIRVDKEDKQQKHQHYKKDVRHLDYIDVYRIIELYELHDPCFQHALKKILVPGARGHKDLTKDINDIIDTMQRKLEMITENEKKL